MCAPQEFVCSSCVFSLALLCFFCPILVGFYLFVIILNVCFYSNKKEKVWNFGRWESGGIWKELGGGES